MSDVDGMDKPVTRREMHDALAKFLVHITNEMDKRFDEVDKRFDEMDKRFERLPTKEWFSAELARHTRAIDERHRTEISVIDDKYTDLPERVGKLEAAVFPEPPAKRQRRR